MVMDGVTTTITAGMKGETVHKVEHRAVEDEKEVAEAAAVVGEDLVGGTS
jgi:hypothetical protein